MSIIIGGERMSQFYAVKMNLKLNKRYVGGKFECIVFTAGDVLAKAALINEFVRISRLFFFSALNTTGKENLEALSKGQL